MKHFRTILIIVAAMLATSCLSTGKGPGYAYKEYSQEEISMDQLVRAIENRNAFYIESKSNDMETRRIYKSIDFEYWIATPIKPNSKGQETIRLDIYNKQAADKADAQLERLAIERWLRENSK